MTRKEYVEKNIGMAFDFIRQLIEHPETIKSIPDNIQLDFIDRDIPFKTKEKIKGQKVIRYKVEHIFEQIKY
ncbi:MAG: hypothetical protein A2W77_07850 [Nitrospinae bacterium RIFCSPLOWO2_12_39_16]|nr:MAG: hypothetical protein A2W77_07850 [Nitrospinae bacterium RIFCSPLOWO2_12_39_16]HLA48872.1 hypothetical protein [Nitrospinota bacterium]